MALRSLARFALSRRVADACFQQATKLQVAVQGPPALTSLLWRRTASSLLQEASASTSTPAFGTEADLVVPLLNQRGRQVGTYTLGGDVFNTEVRRDILHRVVRWQLAARQQGTHKTKTRTEVRGGGRKPRPQKGGGVSRQGSIRAPQWRGGGVAHGPVTRSHAIKLLKRIRRLGLCSALSAKAREGRLLVVDTLRLPQPKTRVLSSTLEGLLAGAPRRSVLLSDLSAEGPDGGEGLRRACANLPWVDLLPSIGLNVYSILRRDYLVLTRQSVEAVQERLRKPIRPQRSTA
ncbi:MRPL4 [Auxenochlorella protothecoides x Auxenochlorella symbiontica]